MRETLPKLPEMGEPPHGAPEIKKESETEVKKICQLNPSPFSTGLHS
jgi:hypothetical protein